MLMLYNHFVMIQHVKIDTQGLDLPGSTPPNALFPPLDSIPLALLVPEPISRFILLPFKVFGPRSTGTDGTGRIFPSTPWLRFTLCNQRHRAFTFRLLSVRSRGLWIARCGRGLWLTACGRVRGRFE